ncbi:DUF6556 family protein [Streptococcus pneumoniae]
MDNYSRKQKKTETKILPKKQHIEKGFTTLQKTIALIGSILSLITASITIHNAFNKDKEKDTSSSEPKVEQQTVIREIEKEIPVSNTETTTQETATSSSDESSAETETSSPFSSSETPASSSSDTTVASSETTPSTSN